MKKTILVSLVTVGLAGCTVIEKWPAYVYFQAIKGRTWL